MDVVLRMLLRMVECGALKPEKDMKYFLVTSKGYIEYRGTIEEVDPVYGGMEGGVPIDNSWVPDIGDDVTFQLCMKQANINLLFG